MNFIHAWSRIIHTNLLLWGHQSAVLTIKCWGLFQVMRILWILLLTVPQHIQKKCFYNFFNFWKGTGFHQLSFEQSNDTSCSVCLQEMNIAASISFYQFFLIFHLTVLLSLLIPGPFYASLDLSLCELFWTTIRLNLMKSCLTICPHPFVCLTCLRPAAWLILVTKVHYHL